MEIQQPQDEPFYGTDTALYKYIFFSQKLLRWSLTHPSYTRQFIAKQLGDLQDGHQEEQLKALEREKDIWIQFSEHNKQSRWFFFISGYYFFFSILRYLAYMYFTVNSMDLGVSSGHVASSGNETHGQLACVYTNCSSLSPGGWPSTDLAYLPVFSICHRQLLWLYSPVINTGLVGLMMVALITYGMFIMIVLVPVYNDKLGAHNRTLMFLLCPHTTTELARRRTLALWQKLFTSYENFRLRKFCLMEQDKIMSLFCQRRQPEDKKSHTSGHLFTSRMLDDCLPINCTAWWHKQLQVATALIGTTAILQSIVIFQLLVAYIYLVRLENDKQHYRDYSRFMRSQNCSMWTNQSQEPIDVGELISGHRLTIFTATELAVGISLALFNISSVCNCFYQAIHDMQVVIGELHVRLLVAIELARLSACLPAAPRQHLREEVYVKTLEESLTNWRRTSNNVTFAQSIREKLYLKQTRYSMGLLTIKRLKCARDTGRAVKLNSRLAYEQFARNLLEQQRDYAEVNFVDLLEKIQIDYWQLIELIDEFKRPLSSVLIFTNAINFGFSIISVYFHRKFDDSVGLPLLVNLLAIVVINVFIAWASTVHSEARKLEPLFWSLVGLTNNHSDQRIAHLNYLWTKQLELIDSRGGLALRAFGANVTYVGILQTLLWTTSIMLLAYTRR